MKSRFARKACAAGFSLIELLVSMAIGLILTLAIASVLIRGEGSKRSSTSVNDINQSGTYVAYTLDRAIRNAGTGFSQSWSSLYGCLLNVSNANAQILPTTFPATSTFANVTQPLRLSPVIIGQGMAGAGGDVLVVMSGTGGASETPLPVTPGSLNSSGLLVSNALGYQVNDIVLLADTGVPAGCMMQEIGAGVGTPSQSVPFSVGGTYYSTTGATVSLANFGANTLMAPLGLETTNPPQFQLFGVGANNALYTYDLLQPAGATNEQPLADGVVKMVALYGLDTGTPPNGKIDSWVAPTGSYSATTLMNGTAASQALLRQIVGIRVGLIMRTSVQERAPSTTMNPEGYLQPAGTVITLFPDAGALAETYALTGTNLSYRFRTIDLTIPLLNVLNAQ
jgi:type IV pilus assembly protein PilW